MTKASSGDTVNVAPGTYAGNITITNSVTVVGDPGDASPGPGGSAPVIDGGSAPGSGFFIANGVSNVTIKGFEIRNFTSNDTGVGNGISAWVGSTSDITIQDNYFHNLGYNGVLVGNDKNADPGKWGDHSYWTIKGNILETFEAYGFELTNASNSSIEDNVIHSNATWNLAATCIMVTARRNASGIVIRGNELDGEMWPGYSAIFVFADSFEVANVNLDTVLIDKNVVLTTSSTATPQVRVYRYAGTGSVTNAKANDNSLSTLKNDKSASNTAPLPVLDASGNWWGTNTAAGVAGAVSANVDYTPWLDGGADTSGDPGFQGDFSVLDVDDDSPQSGSVGRIQEGVNLSDSTVNVAAGTYNETNIMVTKSLTITGDASGPCPGPGPNAPQILGTFTGSERGFIIGSGVDNVTIEGFIVGNMGVVPQTENGGACGVWAYNKLADPTEHITVRNNAFHDIAYTHVFFYNEAQSAYNDINITCNAIDVGVPDYNGYGGNLSGIECTNCINSTIADNTVSGGQIGVFISAQTKTGTTMTAGDLLITRNTISGADFGGIYTVPWSLGGAQPTLQNVSIVDNQLSGYTTAVWVYTSSGSIVRDYSMTGNTITITDPTADGDAVYVSSVAGASNFEGNSVTFAGTAPPSYFRGLNVLGAPTGSWTISENVFTGGAAAGASGAAVRTSNSLALTASLAIDCNRIENWPTGVLSESSNALPVVGSNSIQGNSVGLNHTGAGTLNAENNWWGCASGPGNPGCDTVAGSVDASPAATFVPVCVSCNSNADCDDALVCTGTETCNLLTNVCTAGTAVVCSGQCETGTCMEPTGTCELEIEGTDCDDALFCNGADTCAGGSCSQHAGDPCAAGAECANACNESADNCNVQAGTPCTDDGLPYTQDACDSGACVSTVAPASGCLDAGNSEFSIVDGATDAQDKLRWKWEKGLGTDCAAFGAPGVTTGFNVFVYDGIGGGQYSLGASLHLPAGALWEELGECKEWRYRDKARTTDGIEAVRLVPGPDGNARIMIKAGGVNLPTPTPVSSTKFFTFDSTLIVQMFSDEGVCWQSEFTEAFKNTGEKFKTARRVRVAVP